MTDRQILLMFRQLVLDTMSVVRAPAEINVRASGLHAVEWIKMRDFLESLPEAGGTGHHQETTMETVEEQIKRVGANKGPRITPEYIESLIADEVYGEGSDLGVMKDTSFIPLSLLTLCVLVLRNGFTIVGKSACASPENFNAEVGKRIAREDAVRQIWALEGYHLRCQLAERAAAVQEPGSAAG